MKGYINSIETMGLVDGPGIRVVVFMQGCNLRCMYCHNPETWKKEGGTEITPLELVEKLDRYKPYFENNGGVTFSGGEPLLQPEFLIETLKLCKQFDIHTCIDTSGNGTDMDEEVLKNVDLVLLDLKALTNEDYLKITGNKIDKFNTFLDLCQKLKKPLWLRQVIVPGINDTEKNIKDLNRYISTINNVKKIELLPYHTYGEEKYKKLDIPYKLKGTLPMDAEKLKKLNLLLNKII